MSLSDVKRALESLDIDEFDERSIRRRNSCAPRRRSTGSGRRLYGYAS